MQLAAVWLTEFESVRTAIEPDLKDLKQLSHINYLNAHEMCNIENVQDL